MKNCRSVDLKLPIGRCFILSFFCLLAAGCRTPIPKNTLGLTPEEMRRARAFACFFQAVALGSGAGKGAPAAKASQIDALLREAWDCAPDNPEITALLGQTLEGKKQYQEALSVYLAYLEKRPADGEMAKIALHAALSAKQPDAAARLIRGILARAPDDRKLAKTAILSYFETGKDQECFELARNQFERYRDEGPVRLLLGRACLLLEKSSGRELTEKTIGQEDGADGIRTRERAFLTEALKLVPDNGAHNILRAEILLLLGNCLCELGDLREGFDAFQKAHAMDPSNLVGFQLFSQFLAEDKASLADFLSMARPARDNFGRRLVIAFVNRLQGHKEAALEGFRALVESEMARGHFPCESLFTLLAIQLEQCGKIEESIAVQKRAVAVHPYSASIKNNLAFSLACHNAELGLANRLVTEALRAEPENAAYLDTKGWILFKRNQPYEAIQFFLMAADRERDPEIVAHLRNALLTVGHVAEARLLGE